MTTDPRAKVLELLAKHSYQYIPEGVMLSSGKPSKEYIDCKMALSHAEAFPSVGRLFLASVRPQAVAVGGLTMGADPIAYQTSSFSTTGPGDRNLNWFSVRKQPKMHGLRKLIEGDVPNGANVVIVDDVVTTGGSTREAIQKCREEKLIVLQVLVLVDREEEDGMNVIRDEAGPSVSVAAMFTKSEVRRQWEAQQALRAIA